MPSSSRDIYTDDLDRRVGFLTVHRPAFLHKHGPALADALTELHLKRHGFIACGEGLHAEDAVIEGDEDLSATISSLPAACLLSFHLIGAQCEVPFDSQTTIWDLKDVHAAYLRAILTLVRRSPRLSRQLIQAVRLNDPSTLAAKYMLQQAYIRTMEAMYQRAYTVHCVPPGGWNDSLDKAHRLTFDVLMHILGRWADGTFMPVMLNSTPDKLYGLLMADLWRSEVIAHGDDLMAGAKGDFDLFAKLKRPTGFPFTIKEAFTGAGKAFIRDILCDA